MKNLLKNRIVLGAICIVVSLIICFGLTPMFNHVVKAKVELVRVTKEIKKGEQITASMLTKVEVGGYNLPASVVLELNDVVGKYANADLYKGDYILKDKLSDSPMLKNAYLSNLNGKNRAISVSIKSLAGGLSGKLEPGDIVSLIASDVGELRETMLLPELTYVEIIATTASDGLDNNIQEQSGEEENELASTITVLVSPEQARLLAELEQTGRIHAALVYRGSRENAKKFLNEQETLLNELYPSKTEPSTKGDSKNKTTEQKTSKENEAGTEE